METHFKNIRHILSYKCIKTIRDRFTLNICRNLHKLIKTYDKNTLTNKKYCMLKVLILYDIDELPWTDLFERSKNIKNNSCGLDGLILKYGTVFGNKFFNERRKLVVTNKDNYSNDDWKKLCNKKISNLGKDGYIKKYGKTIGEHKWNVYYTKWKSGIDLKVKSGWKNGISLPEQQSKYGIEDGFNRWSCRIKKRNKTLSLDGFIDRFGEVEGIKKYKIYIKKMIENCRMTGNVSKISQELFSKIYEKLTDEQKTKTCYHNLNKEQTFYINIGESIKLIFVDFKCGNCILEFDGNYWHSFEKTIQNDKIRDDYLKSKGYNILRIKELDFKNDRDDTVKRCIEFIKKYET